GQTTQPAVSPVVPTLRPYQREAVEAVLAARRSGVRSSPADPVVPGWSPWHLANEAATMLRSLAWTEYECPRSSFTAPKRAFAQATITGTASRPARASSTLDYEHRCNEPSPRPRPHPRRRARLRGAAASSHLVGAGRRSVARALLPALR